LVRYINQEILAMNITKHCVATLLVTVGTIPLIHAAPPLLEPVEAIVVNDPTIPVPVVSRTEGDRITITALLSLEEGDAFLETEPVYVVPQGMRLVIEHVQMDARGACFYKWLPTVIVDRPFAGGLIFDRYELALIAQETFGTSYLGAASFPVAITAQADSRIRFGFRRSATDCFGQADVFVDARLEQGDASRVPIED
jgi:hypothetical protein